MENTRQKLIMSGYTKSTEARGIEVWHNRKNKRAVVLSADKVELKIPEVWKCQAYGYGTMRYVDKDQVREMFDIVDFIDEEDFYTIKRIAIDSKGSLLVSSEDAILDYDFFFYEDKNIWVANNNGEFNYYDKISHKKYKFKPDCSANFEFEMCTIYRISSGVLIIANNYIDFERQYVKEFELQAISLYGEVSVVITDCGRVKHWVDIETSSLYIVTESSELEYNNGLTAYGELLNGSGEQKASLFIANGEDCMKPIPRMET